MCKKTQGVKVMSGEDKTTGIHRSNKKRILHILCLILPIAGAFAGYYAAKPLWTLFTAETTTTPELFKLFCSLLAFAIPAIIIFFATRKENPVMKINITSR